MRAAGFDLDAGVGHRERRVLARDRRVRDDDGAPIDTAELALATSLISEGICLSNQLGREVSAEEVRENSVSTAIKL